ncbi:type VII secretion-associated serine protease mycosin [Streptomyces sp. NPDC005551]|uniref:type VII secretion-associated serine protease mycosin n=1 Tax=unclassified Streptomyces TaxID=2593676 RepID=UPI0033CD8EA9
MASTSVAVMLAVSAPAQAHADSTDSTRAQQWHLDAMRAEQMWRSSTGRGVTVAVIDTGVDPENPDLKGRVLDGKDFAPTSRAGDEHTDYDGHGTGMAGLIAGTGAYGGGEGAFGLAPGADILPVRMPDADDVSPFAVSTYFGKGIRYAADSGAKVINVSMSGGISTPELTGAVEHALNKGALVFAAVGNDADKARHVDYPAATPGVVGVAAVGRNLRRAAWSQYGPQVDLAAPGEGMVHACGGKTGLCKTNGTSDATALASASAALIWAAHPAWTNNQVLRVLLNTLGGPTDGAERNDSIGYGIVRPRVALQNPGDPGPPDVYPLPDLAAAASASPTGRAPAAGNSDLSAKAENIAATSVDDGNTTLWIGLGTAAVLLVVAIFGAMIISKRRRRTA